MSDMWTRSNGEDGPPPPSEKEAGDLGYSPKARMTWNRDEQEFVQDFESRIIANLFISREAFIRSLQDNRRDIYAECGFPETGSISANEYQDIFERESLANRVVNVWPEETWQVSPQIFEDDDPDNITPFEEDFRNVCSSLRASSSFGNQPSFYDDAEGNVVWEYLCRLDKQSRIGRYGVLLFGLDDKKDLNLPVTPKQGMKLLFLRTFPESMAQISAVELDKKNPRYGQPTKYLLTLNDPKLGHSLAQASSTQEEVHWTRILHVCEAEGPSEVFSSPAPMLPVLNNLLGLKKLYGASPEMYYKGAFYGLSFETHPILGGEVDVDNSALREMMQQYQNGLQRYLSLTGMSAKVLAPTVVDPTPQIERQIDAVAIGIAMPRRKLTGSERGETANVQDEADWSDRVRARQNKKTTPRIIVPFTDRLIHYGVCRTPKKNYKVYWPDVSAQSGDERAGVAMKLTQALAQWIASGGEKVVSFPDFLVNFLGFKEEAAQNMLKNALAQKKSGEDMLSIDPNAPMPGQTPPPSTATGANPNVPGKGPNPSGGKPKDKAAVDQEIHKGTGPSSGRVTAG
jgi:hypothetical protein